MPRETWFSADDAPVPPPITWRGWLRALRRGGPLILLVAAGLILTLVLRPVEAAVYGIRRPWTPLITIFVCRAALKLLELHVDTQGDKAQDASIVVANHASWLDIFVLNAQQRIYFVSKAEVAGWPGIGWLARATGTVFINRSRSEARKHVALLRDRMQAGHRLLFFPEGTSTDGQRVLPFKPTLFAAFFDPALKDRTVVQPVTVQYHAPKGADPRFYGWWGDMDFGPHLLAILALRRQGQVTITFHPPVRVADVADRKTLAARLETTVRSALPSGDEGKA